MGAKNSARPAGLAAPAPDAGERAVLRALLRATEPAADETEDLSWSPLALAPDALGEELSRLAREYRGRRAPARRTLTAAARRLASRLRVRVWRVDDLQLPVLGGSAHVPRALVGEALGALGSGLLPTRRRALQGSIEAAREITYLGSREPAEQVLPPLTDQVMHLLRGGKGEPRSRGVVFTEEGPLGRREWTTRDLLDADPHFHRRLESAADLIRFQRRLREDPLDGTTVLKLREFFSRRLTVGVRDTARWSLGARHPWFEWERARGLIGSCFDRWGEASFLPRLHRLYTHDVRIPDAELSRLLAANRRAIGRLSRTLASRLPAGLKARLGEDALTHLVAAALDYHHDHPDFDVEAVGRQQGETTARFAGRAALNIARSLAGQAPTPPRNRNVPAFFAATGLTRRWLGELEQPAQERVLSLLTEQLLAQETGPGGPTYDRPPMVLYTFYEGPTPRPKPGETLVDHFPLSAAMSPQHALHLRKHPEILETLSVFFTLVLRHYLDTGHAPDLMPEQRARDFMLLGLWGHNTPHLTVNLYERQSSGKVRCELRFTGRGQVRSYRPDDEGIREANLARAAVSQLGPLLEPSILRALGAFLMAVAEHEEGSHAHGQSRVAVARRAVEVYRETARTGIHGTLVDLATTLEMLLDDSANLAQRGLDRIEGLLEKRG